MKNIIYERRVYQDAMNAKNTDSVEVVLTEEVNGHAIWKIKWNHDEPDDTVLHYYGIWENRNRMIEMAVDLVHTLETEFERLKSVPLEAQLNDDHSKHF